MRVRSLDQEDPLEEKIATHSSLLVGYSPWGCKESNVTKCTCVHKKHQENCTKRDMNDGSNFKAHYVWKRNKNF